MVTAWLVSAVGALAFFLAGFWSGRVRSARREAELTEKAANADRLRERSVARAVELDLALRDNLPAREAAAREREATERAEALAGQVTRLENELRAARARLQSRPPPAPSRPLRAVPRGSRGPRRTSADLAALLGRMGSGRGMKAVALADELGLPIVGSGDDIASLAAFAGYMSDIARKGRDILSLGALRRVLVEDQDDTTITTSILEQEGSTLALVTLTEGPGPGPRQTGEVLRSAVSMIQ